MRARAAASVALLLLAVGVAVYLAQPATTFLDESSRFTDYDNGIVLPAGEALCQKGVQIPAGTVRTRVLASTAGKPGGALTLVARDAAGRIVTRGVSETGYADRFASIPLAPVERTVPDTTLCIRNGGPVQVALLGPYIGPGEPGSAHIVGGTLQGEAVRLEWYEKHLGSRFSRFGVIAERAGLAKPAWFGSWTLWVAFALSLLAGGLAVAAVVRRGKG